MRRDHVGPWIENLIQNYSFQEKQARLKAHVLGISKLPEPQGEPAQNLVARLFLSDGLVQIPGFLTRAAWLRLQELEERESLQSLTHYTVSLCRYTLEFHLESEENKCQFFLAIDEMTTLVLEPAKCHIPSCTTLLIVRQKISETWRSLQGDASSVNVGTQSALCLTELLIEWQEDTTLSLLKDLAVFLSESLQSHQAPSQPSTSRNGLLPATGWDADRVQYKGDPAFMLPMSHLHIPAEQRSPTPRQSAQVSFEEAASLEGLQQMDHGLLPGSEPTNPWDVFVPVAVDTSSLLTGRASLSGSITQDDMPPCNPTPAVSPLLLVPTVTSTQVLSGRREVESPPGPRSTLSLRSGDRSLSPYQRPRASWSRGPQSTGLTGTSRGEEEDHGGIVRKTAWSPFLRTEKGCWKEEEGKKPQKRCAESTRIRGVTSSLLQNPEGHSDASRKTKVSTEAHRKQVEVHADGAPFSYMYEPSAHVRESLSFFRVPEELMQWSAWYLAHRGSTGGTG